MNKKEHLPRQFVEDLFCSTFDDISKEVSDIAKEKGWWKEDRDEAVLIALMHTELSEAVEALRHNNPPSDKIPEFSGVEEEFADVIIRIMDLAVARGYRVSEAIVAKVKYNRTRPYRHGGKQF